MPTRHVVTFWTCFPGASESHTLWTTGGDLPVQTHTGWANHNASIRIYRVGICSLYLSLEPLGHIILSSNLFREALIVLPLYFSLMFPFPPKQLPSKASAARNYPCFSVWCHPLHCPPSAPGESWLQGFSDSEGNGDFSWKHKPLHWFHVSQEH